MLFQVLPIFTIQLHIKDLYLLEKIPAFFGVGVITKKSKSNSVVYSVQYLKDLNLAIIPHFEKYPLLTQKQADFTIFKEVINLMNKGEHLTKDGLDKIINIKASINKGLSEQLKEQFTNVVLVQRPKVEISPLVSDPNWLVSAAPALKPASFLHPYGWSEAGFTEAEWCFLCLVRQNNSFCRASAGTCFASPAQSEGGVRFARPRRVFLLDPCQGQAKKTTGHNLFKDNLNKLLYDLYYKTTFEKESKLNDVFRGKDYYLKIRDIILDNIKYKNMGGARLRVKGRLTRRYRADRAVYKLKWKGGLKNIDSAFKGLSTVQYLGYQDSNVTQSRSVSKRRIGSFGVKTWISGKNYSTASYQRELISPVVQYSDVTVNKVFNY